MASPEQRLKRLEESEGRENRSLIGVLTVDLRDSIRAVNYRLHGFHLEELDATGIPSVPRICSDGMDFATVLAKSRRRLALYKQMEPLKPDVRSKLAAKHGLRVTYPEPRPAEAER